MGKFFKFKKGSAEAREHMARIRKMRGKGKRKAKKNPVKGFYRMAGTNTHSYPWKVIDKDSGHVTSSHPTRASATKEAKRWPWARVEYRGTKSNPVRKLPRVKKGRRTQARKLAAIRAQLHRKGAMIPTRAQFDLRALRKMRGNPSWRAGAFYIAANVSGKAGYFTGNSFDSLPHKAKDYTDRATAMDRAQKLARNYGVLCVVFSGDATLRQIGKVLKL